jgi:hypothetical protein
MTIHAALAQVQWEITGHLTCALPDCNARRFDDDLRSMSEPPRRSRRETAEAPVGIGGFSPHPARGPVTALRVLGRGFEIMLEPDRAERLSGRVGDRLMLKSMMVLAIDEPTRQLIQPLTTYCGLGAHEDVDAALVAILWKRPIILHGSRSEEVLELARMIHAHTIRKDFPFTAVKTVPTSDAAIEALCTEAGCGTIFLDLTRPFELPSTFIRHMFSDHFHLWTIAVAQDVEDVRRCFGSRADFVPFCTLGFRRVAWHHAIHDVTFTQH